MSPSSKEHRRAETVTCEDGHRCDNGSICVEDKYNEGSFYCDCDEIADAAYSGLYCEHKATEYCSENGDYTKISFCTNLGTCRMKVAPGEP